MRPDLREMMSKLIGCGSISSVNPDFDSSNLGVCELLAGWLSDLGFATELLPVPGCPGKFNLIATLGSGPGGLVLSGHTDTVPYDEGRWQYDPFGAVEHDNRLYGLGSADMKCFFALAIEAARALAGQALGAPLIVLATADEESSMSGARALAALGRPKARYAVVGEPTSLRPVRAHKGILMEAVRLQGQSAHSSNPAAGVNAIDGLHELLGALKTLRTELAKRYTDPRFAVPTPTMNFGHVHGGDNPNRVCAHSELHFDVRLTPGMELAATRQLVRDTVRDTLSDSKLHVSFEALFEGVEAHETGADSALLAACVSQTGHTPEVVGFATEAPFLAALGMDTVVIGPGDIAQAHQPDEYLPLSSIKPTLALLQNLIKRFCV